MVEPTLKLVALVFVPALTLSGCFPSLEDQPWLVQDSRILAVRTTPAEARPNEKVQLEALVATPDGSTDQEVSWSYCLAQRLGAERTGVTQSCLSGDNLEPIRSRTTVPMDACSLFGPNPPPAEGDQPQARPADPDSSGGYFLPIQAATFDEANGNEVTAFGFQRIRCDLPAVTRAVFEAYQEQYVPNENPEPSSLEAEHEDGSVADAMQGVSVAAGERVTLRLTPTETSSEHYAVYDAHSSRLLGRDETLSATWFVTGGKLSLGSAILSSEQLQSGAVFDNTWTAPSKPARVFGWVVLRDERSGVSWSAFSFDVQ